MGVEAPAALAALIAAAIPLALHLRSRRAARSVPFPNVELIRELSRESRRERALADAPLMAARAAVIVLAALALSRPYWGKLPPADGPLVEGDMVVMLDRSQAWGEPTAFYEARSVVDDIVRSMRGPARRSVFAFDDIPGPAHGEVALPEALQPSGRRRSMRAALAAAAGIVEPPVGAPDTSPATVVVITTPDGVEEVLAAGAPRGARPPRRARLVVYCPAEAKARAPGPEIVDAELLPPVPRVGEKLRVRVRVRQTGPPAGDEPDSEELGLTLVDSPRDESPAGARVVLPRFPWGNAGGGECVARELEVVIEARRERPGSTLAYVDLVALDPKRPGIVQTRSRRFLTIPPADRLRVLVQSHDREGPEKDMRALERALHALAAASQSSSAVLPLEVVSLPAAKWRPDTMDSFDAVLVGDVAALSRVALHAASKSVSRGTALLAFAPGEVPGQTRALFGIEAVRGRAEVPEGVTVVGWDDEARRGRRSAGTARFASYVRLEPVGRTVLAFDTGEPALVENRIGLGRASLFAAGVAELADEPSALVPFVDAVLRVATGRLSSPALLDAWETPVAVPVAPLDGRTELLLKSPTRWSLRVRPLASAGVSTGERPIVALPCEYPGMWRLEGLHFTTDSTYTETVIGVNAEVAHRPPSAPPDGKPAPRRAPGGDVRVVHSGEELLDALEGRGATALAAPLAALALLAMAVELALVGRRRREGEDGASEDGAPGGEGGAAR